MATPAPRWTAETEELVAASIHLGSKQCVFGLDECLAEGAHRREARAVLEGLTNAGVLTAVGGETRQEWGVDLGAYVGRPFPTRELAEAEIAERRDLGRTYPGEVRQRTVHVGPWRGVTDDPA